MHFGDLATQAGIRPVAAGGFLQWFDSGNGAKSGGTWNREESREIRGRPRRNTESERDDAFDADAGGAKNAIFHKDSGSENAFRKIFRPPYARRLRKTIALRLHPVTCMYCTGRIPGASSFSPLPLSRPSGARQEFLGAAPADPSSDPPLVRGGGGWQGYFPAATGYFGISGI